MNKHDSSNSAVTILKMTIVINQRVVSMYSLPGMAVACSRPQKEE